MASKWEQSKESFINPYIFVDLPSRKSKCKEAGNLTGKITCTLTPKTHMFIPNTSNQYAFYPPIDTEDDSKNHKSYDFYSYQTLTGSEFDRPSCEPVIPGSSIRGEVRALYETLTGSCLSAISDDLILYKRMPHPRNAGMLCKTDGGYELHEAKRFMACYKRCDADNVPKIYNGRETRNNGCFDINAPDLKEGRKVWFKSSGKQYGTKPYEMPETVIEISTSQKPDLDEGYVLKGENFGNRKHHFSIVKKGRTVKTFKNDTLEIKMFERVLELYADRKVNQSLVKGDHCGYKEYSQRFKNIKKVEEIPVFFKEINGVYYITPACISKEVYKNTIRNLLGDLKPCEEKSDKCPACSLFGMVGKDNENAVAGRIRFSDARLSDRQVNDSWDGFFEKPITLNELSSPKISSTEFYMRHPNAPEREFPISTPKISNTPVAEVPQNVRSSHGRKSYTLEQLRAELGYSQPEPKPILRPTPVYKKIATWTYDYANNWSGSNPDPIDYYRPRIKGRKFYWLCSAVNFKDVGIEANNVYNNQIQSNRNNTVRLLKPNASFTFDVYFERLTDSELKKLIAVLRLGENLYHAIGHGKPFGLGRTKIDVTKVKIRELSFQNGVLKRENKSCPEYVSNISPLLSVFGTNNDLKQIAKQVATVCTVHDFSVPIEYPCNTDSEYIFNWFVANRGGVQKPKINQYLRDIPTMTNGSAETSTVEDWIKLFKYERVNNE